MLAIPSSSFIPQTSSTSSSGDSSTGSSTAAANNGLNANSFITLLTTQLQAQDPFNPMDPSQMVSELTQMNTFEQLLQIRQDMDALVGLAKNGGSGNGGSRTGAVSSAVTASGNSAAAPASAALQAALLTSLSRMSSAIPDASSSLSKFF